MEHLVQADNSTTEDLVLDDVAIRVVAEAFVRGSILIVVCTVAKMTGSKSDTLGSALYDLWNPYNSETHKREFRPWSSAGRLFSADPLSRQAETAGMTGSPVAPRGQSQPIELHTTVTIDGKAVGNHKRATPDIAQKFVYFAWAR